MILDRAPSSGSRRKLGKQVRIPGKRSLVEEIGGRARMGLNKSRSGLEGLCMCQQKNDPTFQQLGDSLIQEAISGNLLAVRQLIERGADVNFANCNAFTPLMAAAQWKRLNVLRFLLENGATLSSVENTTGRTALMHACLSGSSQCVQILLEAGAEVNARDSYGMTALMMAAATGGAEMVKPLVQVGAEIDARDELGSNAMDWAKKWRKKNVMSLLSSTDGRTKGLR